MRPILIASIVLSLVVSGLAAAAEPGVQFSGERKRNNLVADLLEVSAISGASSFFAFVRPRAGWVLISAACRGKGTVKILLDDHADALVAHEAGGGEIEEAVRQVAAGDHRVRVECTDDAHVEKLVVKSIPELMHCGLGFNPAIKSYGLYDMDFLKRDVLPNVTTLVVPHNIDLPAPLAAGWHRQGKKFIAEVGISGQAKTVDEHFKYWAELLDKAPILDGILINEFIVNNPWARSGITITPERQQRIDQERQQHQLCEAAIKQLRSDDRYKNKAVYAYIGGSGKKLNYETLGKTFVHTLIDADCRIALERYLFEVSSEQKSKDALQMFVDGVDDWATQEPGVKPKMVIAFGLFSMPPGGINKQPNVDYHVWMDQQMNVVANHPKLADIGGLEWWTSTLADEETVRFVGRLYRHYALEGKTEMLTRDPLFLAHIQNADFEQGTAGWTLQPAEEGSIQARSFPRYGRIEGRFMGLGRPADPEHIGDTFLCMKRSSKGPNTFSQTIKNLEPGRLYSLKMFSCDYQDLVNPKTKTQEEANRFVGSVKVDGVELDAKRSFSEMYASSPEPPVPVWITYHWQVFRAKNATATLTVSDWADDKVPTAGIGQEQTFNFLEIQPYHE